MKGIASPLLPRRIHPHHKWRGILRGSHNEGYFRDTTLVFEGALTREYHGHLGIGFIAGLDRLEIPQ